MCCVLPSSFSSPTPSHPPPPPHTLCLLSLPIPLSFSPPPPPPPLSVAIPPFSVSLPEGWMKKGIVLIPLPSLINNSFVRSAAILSHLPIALQPCVPLSIPLSFSSPSLSLCGYPFPSPYRAPTLCSSFSPYPSLILISLPLSLWLSLPISLSRSNPVFLFLSLSLSHSHLPPSLSVAIPSHLPITLQPCVPLSLPIPLSFSSPSLSLCGYPSCFPITQLRCVPCDRSSGPTCCTCPRAYAGLCIDCTVTESCASTAPSRPPTLWLVSGLVSPMVIR